MGHKGAWELTQGNGSTQALEATLIQTHTISCMTVTYPFRPRDLGLPNTKMGTVKVWNREMYVDKLLSAVL